MHSQTAMSFKLQEQQHSHNTANSLLNNNKMHQIFKPPIQIEFLNQV
jgi:hypothetical protein